MKVTFLPYCKTVEIEKNKKLLDIAIENGISIADEMCFKYLCGRCKVLISKGNNKDYSKNEEKFLTEEEKKKGIRLACSFVVKEDTTVILLKENEKFYNNSEKNIYKKVNIAIDLGTTMVEYVVIGFEDKKELKREKFDNPQKMLGADVITRLTYGYKNNKMMTRLILNEITNKLKCYKNIQNIVIVGNSTMIHFLLQKDITPLTKAPFQSKYKAGEIITAEEMGLNLDENVKIILPFCIGGHVGSDAYACMYSILNDDSKNSMIVDIGTNSEIIINKKGDMIACSTSAGPAFESMLSNGKKYSKNVVKNVKPIENEGDLVGLDMGIEKYKGLCASAIIDLLAIFLKYNIIDKTGYMKENKWAKKIHFTQEDVRKLQLAKSAIKTAMLILMNNEKMDNIYLAGAFGHNINIDNAIKIGLLPNVEKETFKQVGNLALDGAIKIMNDIVYNNKDLKVMKECKHLELARERKFEKMYIENINF